MHVRVFYNIMQGKTFQSIRPEIQAKPISLNFSAEVTMVKKLIITRAFCESTTSRNGASSRQSRYNSYIGCLSLDIATSIS